MNALLVIITLAIPGLAFLLSAHRPNSSWTKGAYVLSFLALAGASYILQMQNANRLNREKESAQQLQRDTQTKLDQAQKFLQTAEDQSRDCNTRIEAVDKKLSIMSLVYPGAIQKRVAEVHRDFTRGVKEDPPKQTSGATVERN